MENSGENNILIYSLINKINNKIYIGQTRQQLKDRFGNYGNGYCNSPHLFSSINKYGKENFYYEILKYCKNQEDANYWESFFISKLDTRNNNKGYNCKSGGSNGLHSIETRNKMSMVAKGRTPSKLCIKNSIIARTGTKASQETRKKQSIAKLGKPSPLVGRKLSEKTKERIGIANKGRIKTNEEIEKIRQANTGQKRSIDARINISKSKIGKKATQEAKINMSESHKGHKHTEQTKLKMANAKRFRFKLSNEKIQNILIDKRPSMTICKDYNVSKTTILNIKKNPKYNT